MILENLKIKDDRPIRAKIKDALVEIPDDVLLKIVSDYNEANGLAPIYKNSDESVNALSQEGYEIDPKIEDTFAFLTPDRYGGVEGFNEIKEKVDFDNELVPYIENNLTTYQNDLHITDDEEILGIKWLKENWQKGKMSHSNRFANVARIVSKVREIDDKFADELEVLIEKYDSKPKVYTYNDLKTDFIKKFEARTYEKKDLTPEEKNNLKAKARHAFNNRYGKNVQKYKDLPDNWKSKLDPYIEGGKVDGFDKVLEELSLTEKEKLEKRGLTRETLLEEFKKIYGFRFDEDKIKDFANNEEIEDPQKFYSCFEATLNAFEESRISFKEALDYFKTVRSYPDEYAHACDLWYAPDKKEVRKEEAERNTDLSSGHSKGEIGELKKSINEKVNQVKASKNKEWINYWEEEFAYYKREYQSGSLELVEFLEELEEVVDYCLEKLKGVKTKTESSGKENEETDQAEKQELDKIKKAVEETEITSGNFLEEFDDFYEDLNDNAKEKLRKNILKKLEDNPNYADELATSTDCVNLLKNLLK